MFLKNKDKIYINTFMFGDTGNSQLFCSFVYYNIAVMEIRRCETNKIEIEGDTALL